MRVKSTGVKGLKSKDYSYSTLDNCVHVLLKYNEHEHRHLLALARCVRAWTDNQKIGGSILTRALVQYFVFRFALNL